MKNVISLFLVITVSVSTAAQQLVLDNAIKLDVGQVVFKPKWDNDNPLVGAIHSIDLPDFDVVLESDSFPQTTFLLPEPDFEVVGEGFGVSCPYEVEDIVINDISGVFSISSITECEYGLVLEQGSDPLFFDPISDMSIQVIFGENEDNLQTMALLDSNASFRKMVSFDRFIIHTGNTMDTLGYTNASGVYSPIDLDTNQLGYFLAFDSEGDLAWNYQNEANFGLSFVRAVTAYEDKLYIGHDNITYSDFIVLDTNGVEVFKKRLDGISIYDINIQNDGSLIINGNYENDFGGGNISLTDNPSLLPSAVSLDAFIAKYDSDFNLLWTQTITGQNIEVAQKR